MKVTATGREEPPLPPTATASKILLILQDVTDIHNPYRPRERSYQFYSFNINDSIKLDDDDDNDDDDDDEEEEEEEEDIDASHPLLKPITPRLTDRLTDRLDGSSWGVVGSKIVSIDIIFEDEITSTTDDGTLEDDTTSTNLEDKVTSTNDDGGLEDEGTIFKGGLKDRVPTSKVVVFDTQSPDKGWLTMYGLMPEGKATFPDDVVSVNGKLYVLGSVFPPKSCWGYVYDPLKDKWTPFQHPCKDQPYLTFRAVIHNDSGGSLASQLLLYFDSLGIYRLQLDTLQWSEFNSLSNFHIKLLTSACSPSLIVGNILYLLNSKYLSACDLSQESEPYPLVNHNGCQPIHFSLNERPNGGIFHLLYLGNRSGNPTFCLVWTRHTDHTSWPPVQVINCLTFYVLPKKEFINLFGAEAVIVTYDRYRAHGKVLRACFNLDGSNICTAEMEKRSASNEMEQEKECSEPPKGGSEQVIVTGEMEELNQTEPPYQCHSEAPKGSSSEMQQLKGSSAHPKDEKSAAGIEQPKDEESAGGTEQPKDEESAAGSAEQPKDGSSDTQQNSESAKGRSSEMQQLKQSKSESALGRSSESPIGRCIETQEGSSREPPQERSTDMEGSAERTDTQLSERNSESPNNISGWRKCFCGLLDNA